MFSVLKPQRGSGHGEAWSPALPLSPTRRVAPAPNAPFWEPLVSVCKVVPSLSLIAACEGQTRRG